MDPITFFFAVGNLPFAIALTLMCGIGAIEVVSMLLGLGVSELIDNAIGFDSDVDVDVDVDFDVDVDVDFDVDVDMDMDLDADVVSIEGKYEGSLDLDMEHGWLTSALAWLQLGKVPVLILFCAFLLSFGSIGLIGQWIVAGILGSPISALLAGPIAFIGALPLTRSFGKFFGRIIPKEETSAIRVEDLTGGVARIIIGTAKHDLPAEAKIVDEHGTAHYVRVIPQSEEEEFPRGTEVILTKMDGNVFRATKR